MMKKKYIVVEGNLGMEAEYFMKKVSELMNDGWKLYGNPFVKGYQGATVAQALIKDE